MPMLEVSGLEVRFRGASRDEVRAVRGVTFSVERGECVGLVGESGCGKTSVVNAIVGLVPASGGKLVIDGEVPQGGQAMAGSLARKVQLVFQDPFGSLNPRMTLGDVLEEVLVVHSLGSVGKSRETKIAEIFRMVELDPDLSTRYPHELSGGQRQRFGIARALAVEPQLLLADEPVSALDVSVQVQILNLLREVVVAQNIACLFIAHDLAAVRYLCDRVIVMYLGEIVESGSCDTVFASPAHPYTQSLLEAVPDIERGLAEREQGGRSASLEGEVPSALERIPGCGFHPRCPRRESICESETPGEVWLPDEHMSRCHFAKAVAGE